MKSIEEILAYTLDRPLSEEALAYEEEKIVSTGKKLGYKFSHNAMKKILSVHESFMPIIESGIISLLKKNEKNKPDYYVFARDGELIFDALMGVSFENKEFNKRIFYLKTSTGVKLEDEVSKGMNKYLKEIGITQERFTNGPLMIFLDSGFIGSLFHKVGSWANYGRKKLPNKNQKGYLVSKSFESKFNQINLINSLEEDRKKFNIAISNSPYKKYKKENDYNLNFESCSFMQLMPKFTGRYVTPYQTEEGRWDVLPEINPKLKSNLNLIRDSRQDSACNQKSRIIKDVDYINEDIVNPIASMFLQRRTLIYFSDQKIQEKIYKKANL
ncbi:MAG: hypothetical protein KJ949_03445 [Nanoarchaeota archaeon]|nr:hypothetical protein [Nanoarchaeota archaeon]